MSGLGPPSDSEAIPPALGALSLGQQFSGFAEFKAAMANWSARAGFDIRYDKSQRKFNVVVCWIPECTFRVRASLKDKIGCVEITVLDDTHTACAGVLPSKRRSASTHNFLRTAVPKALAVDKTTKPKDVVKAIKHEYNQSITYHAAHKVLGTLNGVSMDAEREQYRQLGLLVETIRQADPEVALTLNVNPETARFRNFFICPSAARKSFENGCLPLLVCDGTFTKGKFRQILLFAVSLDANNHVLLLAWAIVSSENEANWRFFLGSLAT
jgi:hypothetical protein